MNLTRLREQPTAARFATAAVFFVHGATFANWVARIPEVKAAIGLSEGQLGVALLGIAAGLVVSFPFAGGLNARFGSYRITMIGGVLNSLSLIGPGLAGSGLGLFAALMFFGVSAGLMDISMNAQGVLVEEEVGHPIMSSFHAMFSLGGLAGALFGGLMISLGVPVLAHFIGVALVLTMVVLVVIPLMLKTRSEDPGPAIVLPTPALYGLGVIVFCSAVIEGAMADWSTLYLSDVVGLEGGTAALGFAGFTLAMTAARLLGDRLTTRFGSVAMVRGGAALAAVGLTFGLLGAAAVPSILGFTAVGAGIALVFPLVLSAAGRTPGMDTGAGVAAAASFGYVGFFIGPPLIGFLAEAITLRGALGVAVVLSLVIVVFAGAVRR